MLFIKWIKIYAVVSLSLLFMVGLVNYVIDPLWIFKHSNIFNQKQESFNERQQKINKIYFNNINEFDTLLLGSSRSTYINQNDFSNMKVFNMSAGNMFPSEYEDFINVIKKMRGKEFKYIILGMDFFGSNINSIKHKSAYSYLLNSKQLGYKYKTLLSLDTLKYSLKNILNTFQQPNIYYTRDNVRIHKIIDEGKRKENHRLALQNHMDTFKYEYVYNKGLFSLLQKIKKENVNTKFIVFTTPATAELLKSTLGNPKLFQSYSNWLYDMVGIFGKVYHFYDFNCVTINKKNYPDDEHYYPYIGKMIAQKVSKKNNKNIALDFGIILMEDNIKEYLQKLSEKIKDNK